MYHLINTSARPEVTLSHHRTAAAAGRAMGRTQRAVKRASGAGSYLMLTVRGDGNDALSDDDAGIVADACSETLAPR